MQNFRVILLTFFVTASAFAVDLSNATNQQLLDEVSRRMTGMSPGGSAIASYICDSAYLKISVIGEKTSGSASIYLGSLDKCLEQATPLNKYKSKVYALMIAAVCDSAYLKRYGLYTSGELKEVDSVYMGSYDKCIIQAKQINENRI